MSDVVYTSELTRDYMQALRHQKSAAENLVRAEANLAIVGNKLAERIAPSDMQAGESIGVWHRVNTEEERCFVIRKAGDSNDLTITMRGKPKPVEKEE